MPTTRNIINAQIRKNKGNEHSQTFEEHEWEDVETCPDIEVISYEMVEEETPDGPTETMTVASDGNIGLNVLSPEERLHIGGNLKVDGIIKGHSKVQKVASVDEMTENEVQYELTEIDGLRLRGLYYKDKNANVHLVITL